MLRLSEATDVAIIASGWHITVIQSAAGEQCCDLARGWLLRHKIKYKVMEIKELRVAWWVFRVALSKVWTEMLYFVCHRDKLLNHDKDA